MKAYRTLTPRPSTPDQPTENRATKQRQQYAKVAGQSSKLVNGYGSAIQIIGIVYGIVTLIFCIWVGGLADNTFVGFLLGLVYSSLIIGAFAVLGALFRMVSNYILFKTTE